MAERKSIPLSERFQRYIGAATESGCVLWTGATTAKGYGSIGSGGRGRTLLAHRVAWELARGPIPDGLSVLHRCDTPACVAVEHLFLGTRIDNAADRNAKGREARGEMYPQAKLTEQSVRMIRWRYAAGGATMQQLADQFGVSHTVVQGVIRRRIWKHVT